MLFKEMSVKKITEIISPLLIRNFQEWKKLKKEISLKGRIKFLKDKDDDNLEKILSSEPVAWFYAYWLKFGESIEEKIISYIRGFTGELRTEKAAKDLFDKCNLIADVKREQTSKIVKLVLDLQSLKYEDFKKIFENKENEAAYRFLIKNVSKKIFENEAAYRILIKSVFTQDNWMLHQNFLLRELSYEVEKERLKFFYKISDHVIEKRKKELFS